MSSKLARVITFGTFDLFHVGHLSILERAAERGVHLTVGVSSDKLNFEKKGFYPTYSESDRMRIVQAIGCVDHVFLEKSLEQKADYVEQFGAQLLVMGSDWENEFDWVEEATGCKVLYLPRTRGISSTQIKAELRGN